MTNHTDLITVLRAILNDCDTEHDERGYAYIKVPARSLNDIGARIRAVIQSHEANCADCRSEPESA